MLYESTKHGINKLMPSSAEMADKFPNFSIGLNAI